MGDQSPVRPTGTYLSIYSSTVIPKSLRRLTKNSRLSWRKPRLLKPHLHSTSIWLTLELVVPRLLLSTLMRTVLHLALLPTPQVRKLLASLLLVLVIHRTELVGTPPQQVMLRLPRLPTGNR